MELVSVIVPVYNVEKYLSECIDSILASIYQNLEIILVDDGSKDASSVICDQYAQIDDRIRVIHQQNKGIVGARNAGLDIAQGEFVAFVDADDTISPLLYQEMVSVINAENADVVACEYRKRKEDLVIFEDGGTDCCYAFHSFDEQLAVLTCAPSIREYTWTGPYVWNKLYRRANISANFRKECLMCEDLRFNWDYIQTCRKMVIIPKGLYFYRLNTESITGIYTFKKNNKVNIANGVANASLWAFIADSSAVTTPQLNEYLEARAAYVAHGALWRVYRSKSDEEYSDFVSASKQLINNHTGKLLRDTQTYNFKLRCMIRICRYCFPIWKIAARISALF